MRKTINGISACLSRFCFLVTCSFILLISFSSCGDEDELSAKGTKERLEAPDTYVLDCENRCITWNKVEHAKGYICTFDGEVFYEVGIPSIYIPNEVKVENWYTMRVQAVADATTAWENSDYSSFRFLLSRDPVLPAPSGFSYTIVGESENSSGWKEKEVKISWGYVPYAASYKYTCGRLLSLGDNGSSLIPFLKDGQTIQNNVIYNLTSGTYELSVTAFPVAGSEYTVSKAGIFTFTIQ